MRLVVLVGSRPEARRIFAPGARFLSEVMGLAAALVGEIGGEIEAALVCRQAVEFYQRQLDLGMAVVAALVAGTAPNVAAMWSR